MPFDPIASEFISPVIPLFQLFSHYWRVFPHGDKLSAGDSVGSGCGATWQRAPALGVESYLQLHQDACVANGAFRPAALSYIVFL